MTAPLASSGAVSAYTAALEQARATGYRLGSEGIARLRRAFGHAIAALTEEINSTGPDAVLTRARAESLRAQILATIQAIENQIVAITAGTVEATADQVIAIHREANLSIARLQAPDLAPRLAGAFDSLATNATVTLAARGQTAATFRTLVRRHRTDAIDALDTLLTSSVARGVSVARLTKDVAALLAGGEPDSKTYGLDPSNVSGLKTLLYDARRIAQTETNTALREGNRLALLTSPMIKAVTWQLSGRHRAIYPLPKRDECDDLAEGNDPEDLAELGPLPPGYYSPKRFPFGPHPFCGCMQGGPPIFYRPSEWAARLGKTPPPPPKPKAKGFFIVNRKGEVRGSRAADGSAFRTAAGAQSVLDRMRQAYDRSATKPSEDPHTFRVVPADQVGIPLPDAGHEPGAQGWAIVNPDGRVMRSPPDGTFFRTEAEAATALDGARADFDSGRRNFGDENPHDWRVVPAANVGKPTGVTRTPKPDDVTDEDLLREASDIVERAPTLPTVAGLSTLLGNNHPGVAPARIRAAAEAAIASAITDEDLIQEGVDLIAAAKTRPTERNLAGLLAAKHPTIAPARLQFAAKAALLASIATVSVEDLIARATTLLQQGIADDKVARIMRGQFGPVGVSDEAIDQAIEEAKVRLGGNDPVKEAAADGLNYIRGHMAGGDIVSEALVAAYIESIWSRLTPAQATEAARLAISQFRASPPPAPEVVAFAKKLFLQGYSDAEAIDTVGYWFPVYNAKDIVAEAKASAPGQAMTDEEIVVEMADRLAKGDTQYEITGSHARYGITNARAYELLQLAIARLARRDRTTLVEQMARLLLGRGMNQRDVVDRIIGAVGGLGPLEATAVRDRVARIDAELNPPIAPTADLLGQAKTARESLASVKGERDALLAELAAERKALTDAVSKNIEASFNALQAGASREDVRVFDAEMDVIRDKSAALAVRERAAAEEARKKALGLIEFSEAERTKAAITFEGRPDAKKREVWEKGVDAFRRLVPRGFLENLPVSIQSTRKGRSFYSTGTLKVSMEPHGSFDVVVHELGHAIEDAHQDILAALKAELARRTQGQASVRMSALFPGHGYSKSEVTKPDKFFHPYVGKFYDDATEMLSMALQEMAKDPIGFAEKDPELFDFIYGLMRTKPNPSKIRFRKKVGP